MTLRYFPSSLVDSIIEASKKTKAKASEPTKKAEKYITKEAEAALEKVTNFAISKVNDSFNVEDILKLTVPTEKREAVENVKKTMGLVAKSIVDELTKKVFDPNIDKDVSEKEDVVWTAEELIRKKTVDLNTAITSVYRFQSESSLIPTDTFLRSISKAISEKIADGFSKGERTQVINSFWTSFGEEMSKVDTSDEVESPEEELPFELPAAQEENDIASLERNITKLDNELKVAKENYKKSPNETNKRNVESLATRKTSLENALARLTRTRDEDLSVGSKESLDDLVNRLNKVDWNYQQADDPSAFRDGQTAVEKAKKEIDGLPADTLNNLSTDPKLVKDAKFWVEDALKKVGGKPIVVAKEKVQVDYFENFKNSSQSLEGDFLKIIKRFKDQFVIKFKKGAPTKGSSSTTFYIKGKSAGEASLTLRNAFEALEKEFKGDEKKPGTFVPDFSVEINNDKTSGVISVVILTKDDTSLAQLLTASLKTPAGSNLFRNFLTRKIEEASSFKAPEKSSTVPGPEPVTQVIAPVKSTKEKIGNISKTIRKLDTSTFEDLVGFVAEAQPKSLGDYNIAIERTANFYQDTKNSIAFEISDLVSKISSIEADIKAAQDAGETTEAADLRDQLKQLKVSKSEKESQEKEINEKISRLESLTATMNQVPAFAKQQGELLFINPQSSAVSVSGDSVDYVIETTGKEYNASTATTSTFISNQDAKTVETAIESLIRGIRKVVIREKQEDETDRNVLGGVKISLRFSTPSFIASISYNKAKENLLGDELAKMPESRDFRSNFTKKDGNLTITKRVATAPVAKPSSGKAEPLKSKNTPKGRVFQYGDEWTAKEKVQTELLQITKNQGSKATGVEFNKFVDSFINNIKAQKTSGNLKKIVINARELDKDDNPLFQIDVTYFKNDLPYINRAKQTSMYESEFGLTLPKATAAKPVAPVKPEGVPAKPPTKVSVAAASKVEPAVVAPSITTPVAKQPATTAVAPPTPPEEETVTAEPATEPAPNAPEVESDDLTAELESLKLERDALDAQMVDVAKYIIDAEERSSQIEEIEKEKLNIDRKMRDIVNQLEGQKEEPAATVTEPEAEPVAAPKEKPAVVEPSTTTPTPSGVAAEPTSLEMEKLNKIQRDLKPIANLWRLVKQKGGNAIAVSNVLRKASEQLGDPDFANKLFSTAKELV